jgi:hypothetical protein
MRRRIPSSPASLCAIGVVLGAVCFPSWAAAPYLVKDINPAPGIGGFPDVDTVVNGRFLLWADAR